MNRILVTQSSMPPLDEYMAEIASLWESKWLTNRGTKVRALEQGLLEYLGVDHGVLFANGHVALETLLQAFDLSGEVITTPFTFASTTHAIVRTGLTPVFADIRMNDFTIDPAAVEAAITPRTSAILAVHVYGTLCDVDALQDIARRHGLALVYDAAHAFGVTHDGKGAAAFGDASMYSFHATKVFNTIEGGFAVVKDAAMVEPLQQLQNFGITGPETVERVGGNGKMNEFAAAMGLCNLRHVDDEIAKRATAAARYREALDGVAGLTLMNAPGGARENHAYFPVLVDPREFGATRDEVFEHLMAHGVVARKYFYPLVSDFACYRDLYDSRDTPVARAAADAVLTLPMYADLSLSDVDMISDLLLEMGADA